MKLIKLFTVGLMIFSLLLATACSNSASSTKADKVTLKYWSMWNKGEAQQIVIQKIIDDYEKANPNVDIDVQWMGRQVLAKVRTASLSNDAPDLTDKSFDELMGTLISKDLTEPLNDLLEKQIPNEKVPFESVLIDNLLEKVTYKDNVVFIPYEVINSGFHYNEKLFKELGVSAPKTWDEFVSIGKKMKSEGIAPLAQDGNIDFYNAYYYYWLTNRILGPSKFKEAAGDKTGASWDDAGFLQAAEKIEEIVKAGFFMEGYQGSQYPAAQTAWAQGKSGMTLNGSWLSKETSSYAPAGFSYRAFPFPQVEGGKGDYHSTEFYLIGWTVPKGGNVGSAKDFLAFAMQKKYQQELSGKSSVISSRKDIPAPETLKDFKSMIETSTGYHPVYDGLREAYPEWWKTVFLPLDDKLVFGEITASDFIKELKAQSIKYWQKN
ncbi:ABC transporter substrate-binding protein [Neobacillus sp. SAB-20_R2A]|uniref:ABC transporter substrate-binding protein n=1 Tax=Neobacillus sp. SAB-20_R2A TaxID=3120519 RepID=UPI003C6DD778